MRLFLSQNCPKYCCYCWKFKMRSPWYNPPFTTCVRGLCHDSQPRFLPARADRSGVGVSHARLVVAIGARRRSTDTTHARDATTQTLHGAHTLYGSHPSTPLRRL